MYCSNCGYKNSNNSNFCISCGSKLNSSITKNIESNHRIQMKCKNCEGTLDLINGQNILICPFCGSKEILIENDKITIQRIKSNTTKDLVFGVADRITEIQRQKTEAFKKEQEEKRKQLKILLPIMLAFLAFLFIIAIIMASKLLTFPL